ncbi:MAG: hypothetical protein K6G03_01880 [Lachnospiraceae bacterium]|nr:hypothetical protein [Lachnospiraceae bacterium]
MKRIKRALCIVLTLMIIFTLMPHRTASAASRKDIKKVTTLTDNLFKNIKTYNITNVGKVIKANSKAANYYYWKDKRIAKIVRKINKENLTYSIKDVKVKGNKATAKVTVIYYDASSDYEEAFCDAISWYSKHKTASSDSFKKTLAKYFKEYYEETFEDDEDEDDEDDYSDTEYSGEYAEGYEEDEDEDDYYDEDYFNRKTVTLKLEKINGKWLIVSTSKNFQNALDGGTVKKNQYIQKNLKSYIWKYYF